MFRKSTALIVVVAAFLLAVTSLASPWVNSQAYAQTVASPAFSKPINLSNDTAVAQFPNVQSVGGHVYVSWTENSSGIKFRESSNGGKTWGGTLTVSKGVSGMAQYPLMSANGSNVYVVWSEGASSSSVQVYEATSTDYGASFSSPVAVTSGAGPYVTPVIASWGNNVYVAYIYNGANKAAYVSCNSNRGQGTWTAPFYLGNREPQLAAWGGQDLYAVADWSVSVTNNNCVHWQQHTPGQWKVGTLLPREPWIWAFGSSVYVVWETGGTGSVVRLLMSHDYGSSWTTPKTLSGSMPDAWAPMMWAYGNSAWIAFREYPGGAKGQVWVLSTSNNGKNWVSTSLSGVAGKGTAETFPYTVRSSDGVNVFVAWSHQVKPGYWTFVVSYSSDGGKTWTASPGLDVSNNKNGEAGYENDVATGSISSSGTHCYAVWQYTDGTTNQIYFTHS